MRKSKVSRSFLRMCSTLKGSGDSNYCAVIALAYATGESVEKAQEALSLAGRPIGEGATRPQIFNALNELGYHWWNDNESEIGKRLSKCVTVNQCDRVANSGDESDSFLVIVKGHILAISNKRVQDWTRDGKHRVRDVIRVVPA